MAVIYSDTSVSFDSISDPETATVTAEGVVFNSSVVFGLKFESLPNTVTVNGIVGATFSDADAIIFENGGVGLSNLTVGATGEIFGDYSGARAFHRLNVTNSGKISGGFYGLDLEGNGSYTVKNNASGEIVGAAFDAIFITGSGLHTIINKGSLSSALQFAIESDGTGVERVTNSGIITGNILLGANNDSIKNIGKGSIVGNVHLGAGNDTYTDMASAADHVFDSSDSDTIKLGGGNDIYSAIRDALFDPLTDGVDTVDGGKGSDVYDAIAATVNLRINLDSKNRFDPISEFSLLANRATDLGAGETGQDKISNFENANGGAGNDIIFGNKFANALEGNFGIDHLYGLGGNDSLGGSEGGDALFGGSGDDLLAGGGENDQLEGGSGNDRLVGGTGVDILVGSAGKDILQGGDGFDDSAVDFFRFTSVSDSTPGRATRDVIVDFEDGMDVLDLTSIAVVDYLAENAAFTNTAGEVRSVRIASGWVLQGDMDGNGKVDIAIEVRDVTHSITWADDDFAVII